MKFASRMERLKPSEIREISKHSSTPGFISFAAGNPAPELFPVEDIKAACCAVLEENGRVALQYSPSEGYVKLRGQIAQRMQDRFGVRTDADHIRMVVGSQQGLEIAAHLFLDPDDVVILEGPSYSGALRAFTACQPRFIEIPTDDDGMIMEELERVLATTERVKLIYVIPDFHNPTGRSWSLERRKKFIEIINRYEIPVVEDDPYGELRYEGEALPPLKALDTKELVIFLGSFSKVLVPGYRLGWVCASQEIVNKVTILLQTSTLQASGAAQLEVSKYLEMFDLDAHIEKLRQVYGHRRDLMMQTIRSEFPDCVKCTHPKGGLFLWLELPEYIDTMEMSRQAIEAKVGYVPGGPSFPNGGHRNCLRLNFSMASDEEIVTGIRRLAGVIRDNLR